MHLLARRERSLLNSLELPVAFAGSERLKPKQGVSQMIRCVISVSGQFPCVCLRGVVLCLQELMEGSWEERRHPRSSTVIRAGGEAEALEPRLGLTWAEPPVREAGGGWCKDPSGAGLHQGSFLY